MLEVEVKVRLEEPDRLRRRLRDLGAAYDGTAVESDVYLQHPGRDLARTDEALRIRTRDGRRTLTYKGPRQDSAAKVRAEHNVDVTTDPLPLLEALGFRPAARLEKTRESWRLGDLHVSIDAVAGLGVFAEVEVTGPDAGTAERAVEQAVTELGLAHAPRHRDSYLELALAAGAAAVQPRE